MKTYFFSILLLTFAMVGCATEKCIRIDRLAEHKTDFVYRQINQGEYREDLLRVSDETKRIYSLIRKGDGIYFRERDSFGKLLAEHKVTNDWFEWYLRERAGDYEPTTQRLVYFTKDGNLNLVELATGVTRTIWRGGKANAVMNQANPLYIRFVDTDHVLLIYAKYTEGIGTSWPTCIVSVSMTGEEKRITEQRDSLMDFLIANNGRLYYLNIFIKTPYLGYIDLHGISPDPKQIRTLPEDGSGAMDISRDGKKAVVTWMGDAKQGRSSQLIEIDITSGQSREIANFGKEDKVKSVYPRVQYLNENEVAVTICPNSFWNWAGNNTIRVYNVKSGEVLREISAPNLELFGVLHEGDKAIMVSSVY